MPQTEFNIHDFLRLCAIPQIGSQRLRLLITHFGNPTDVLSATPKQLTNVEGIDKKLASIIAHYKEGKQFADEQLSRLNKINGSIITLWDSNYPELLRKIYDPPAFLFIRGNIIPQDKYSIAIVGTRTPTHYGKIVTEQFSQKFSEMGITVISGLARGIDTVAHHTICASQGRTLAIIGSGIDRIYPAENKKLASEIEKHGAIISEFFMGGKPDPGNFPRRNRIISGLSLGTLLVESTEDGGGMITAYLTVEQNRELFCIPGTITEKYSKGPNKLIREGQAKLVQSIDDILEELQTALSPIIKPTISKPKIQLTMFEQKIYDVLTYEPLHIDFIAEQVQFSISDVLVNLLSLEFKGMIKQLVGKMFVKV